MLVTSSSMRQWPTYVATMSSSILRAARVRLSGGGNRLAEGSETSAREHAPKQTADHHV